MSVVPFLLLTIVIASTYAQRQCERITVNTDTVVGTCCLSPKNPNRPEDVRNYALHYLPPGPRPGPPHSRPPPPPDGRPFPDRPRPPVPPTSSSQAPLTSQASAETSNLEKTSSSTTMATTTVTTQSSSTTIDKSHKTTEDGGDSGFVFPNEITTTVKTENKIAIDVPPNGCVNGGARDPSGKCVTPF
ncbi:hypothetical protein GWI33_018237 [Rhynchophorus ferrugineus]|uniref:Uncharacterized protein n=1 Tax=Rhynchophorus ferrugineus TaxID=354439 RepID=A0A834M5G2_RHYFE|nr:hypothetical protein GWI33_018237 [Rhynchophorus ferrugineus]